MLVFLRCVGVTNGAVWLGAAIFYAFGVSTAFSSPAMFHLLPLSHAGAAEQIVMDYYVRLQYWCGGIALAHLLVEWLYTGKALKRWLLYLLLGLLGLGVLNGSGLRPWLKKLHLDAYGVRSTAEQRSQGIRSFRIWHSVQQMTNYLTAAGILVYVLQAATTSAAPRYPGYPASKRFKG